MGELNRQFEAFPEIKIRLENGDVFFNERKQTYASEFSTLHTGFVNGAWYAFQEQQSKIEQLEKEKQALHNAFVYMDECRKEWHKAYMSLREEKALRGES
ncbi:hypothetical protein A6M14_09565 [Acinetobacter sp. Ac_877]|uniref:hypothetical protein n=1 Tax=Acinetobacter portensis TaxID=1839785 RepID=UPI00128B0964|nr:hypothetical protein [Acinetobacter portensis]MPW41715.1 hypothetical protein [Acinetobacter portensis]